MKLRFSSSALQVAAVLAAAVALSACDRASTDNTSGAAPAPQEEVVTAESVVVENAPASEASTPASTASTLQDLDKSVGTYPGDNSYLVSGVLAERLKALLGEDTYKLVLQNLEVASPLSRDGERLFITGNRAHQGGEEMAAIVVDPAQNAVRVWLSTEGKSQVFQDPAQVEVPWPADVQTMISNFQESKQ